MVFRIIALLSTVLLLVGCSGVSFGLRTSYTHDRPDERQLAIQRDARNPSIEIPNELRFSNGIVFKRCGLGSSCLTRRYVSCEAQGLETAQLQLGSDPAYRRINIYQKTQTVYWEVPDGLRDSRGFPSHDKTWAEYGPQEVYPESLDPNLTCQSDGTLTTRSQF